MKKWTVFAALLCLLFSLAVPGQVAAETEDVDFSVTFDRTSNIFDLSVFQYIFNGLVVNDGTESDSYTIGIYDLNLPDSWFANFCSDSLGICVFQPIDTADFNGVLEPGDQLDVYIDISTFDVPGTGSLTLRVESNTDSNIMFEQTFTVSAGADVMIVDDDGSESYEQAYHQIFDDLGLVYFPIQQSELEPHTVLPHTPDLALDGLKGIFWHTGAAVPAFVPEDVDLLTEYLDGGGNLFLAGHGIGADIAEGQSNFAEAQAFYADYLGANYVGEYADAASMTGVAGDPITDGISFDLADPYGVVPEVVESDNGSSLEILHYADGYAGGLRYTDGGFKTVYLSVALEQIGDPSAAQTIVTRTLDWFDVTVGIEDDEATPLVSWPILRQNYPNPFNPSTTIRFALPHAGHVKLAVYNAAGQLVDTLLEEDKAAGNYDVSWNAEQVPSGVYFYQMRFDGNTQTRKMILMK